MESQQVSARDDNQALCDMPINPHTQKPRARLENWYFIEWSNQLTGKVYGHPRAVPDGELADGNIIYTSTIVRMSDDRKEAETLNTIYDLGQELLPKSMTP